MSVQEFPLSANAAAAECNGDIVDLIPALRAFARTFHRDETDADDLVQMTLMKGLANIDKFEKATRMKSWLFTIMRNTFLTEAKKRKREAPGLADCASGRVTTEASQEWTVRGKEIGNAISSLPEAQRQVLVLVAMLGTSYDDAAQICGCNIGTIKSRLSRARTSLISALGEASSRRVLERSDLISRHGIEDCPAF